MPIDFPLSPTINQQYTVGDRTWVWNGTAWQLRNLAAAGYTGSTGFTGSQGAGFTGSKGALNITYANTAPISPTFGDVWIHSDTGINYTYTDDGNSSQWIEYGNLGVTGYTGSAGAFSAIGFTGSQGDIGFTGSAGAGFTGSASTVIGYTGSQGGDVMILACSDETVALLSGNGKVIFRLPYAINLYQLPRASVSTASSSGLIAVDITAGGVSIFSTALTIDAFEKTSTTAATPAVLSTTSIADDVEISVNLTSAGTGAAGLKIYLYYRKV
jgi:hypothetical protein